MRFRRANPYAPCGLPAKMPSQKRRKLGDIMYRGNMDSFGKKFPRQLLLATNNPAKAAELRALLREIDVEILSPAEIGLALVVAENGQTYAENARLKALAFARASNRITLGDDSGLEVDALDGQPGVHSNRFAPLPHATDADRRRYLLSLLQGKPPPWTARFRAALAIALPTGKVFLALGACEGEIIPEERGEHGFGYDPIFLLPTLGRTMAELTMEEKNRLSHRAQAAREAIPILLEILREH